MIHFGLRLAFVLFFTLPLFKSYSEPWLSNRYAQNCAACHAPGRVNRPYNKRKCSLSCEGCHVNPMGGGLRSFYGKWGQKKWLRSLTWSKWTAGENPPAPRPKQLYAHRYPKEIRPAMSKARFNKLNKVFGKRKRVPQVDSKSPFIDERHFEMSRHKPGDHEAETKSEFEKDPGHGYEANDQEFESLIPKDDPYFLTKEGRVEAGIDARYFILQRDVNGTSDSGESLMAFDYGISVKPWMPNLSFTFEHRYFNDPFTAEWDAAFAGRGITRSAYVKLNELKYNSYAMAGIYRPMFGIDNPNHFALRQNILYRTSNGSQNAVYEGISFGAAPNVPFFNVSYLFKGMPGIGDQSTGFVMNAGMRAVRNGMSAVLSYWQTEKDLNGNTLKKQMMSASGGFNFFNRIIGGGEIAFFKDDSINGLNVVRNKGYLLDLDLKYRMWREFYPQVKYAITNVARDLSAGSTTELTFGAKFFAFAGLELELLYTAGVEKIDATTIKNDYNYFMLQTHAFW